MVRLTMGGTEGDEILDGSVSTMDICGLIY